MGHGDHWECLVDDVNVFLQQNIRRIIQDSDLTHRLEHSGVCDMFPQDQTKHDVGILNFKDESNDFGITSVIFNNKFWTAYPVMFDFMNLPVTIQRINDWGNYVEGQVSVSVDGMDGFEVSFFDSLYVVNYKEYEMGMKGHLHLSGLVYKMIKKPCRLI